MIRSIVIPALALAGIAIATWTTAQSQRPIVPAPAVSEPPRPVFASAISGSGLVEPPTEDIAIGTPYSGIVVAVPVSPGQIVKEGDVLFQLDTRELEREAQSREAALLLAKEKLARLAAAPRAEDLPPARAAVAEAEASLAEARGLLHIVESLDPGTVSEERLIQRRSGVAAAEARLAKAKAELALLEAGTWAPDLAVAQQEVAAAEAALAGVRTAIERHTVRAPREAKVLRVETRPGEFAQAGANATPLIVLGGLGPLCIRVDIDESDIWRFRKDAAAVAYVRGNGTLSTPLAFLRIEPYVVPKRSLTGSSSERVDTRVMQAIYRIESSDLELLVGQQMDVMIEADGSAAAR